MFTLMLERDQVLPHTVEALAHDRGGDVAMIDVNGPSMTWAELHDQCLRWAAAYLEVGVAPGDTIVTMLPNTLDSYLTWLGAAWAGALEVPANNMFRGETLRYLLENSLARLLVIAERYVPRLAEVADQLSTLEAVVVLDASSAPEGLPFRVLTGQEFLKPGPAQGLTGPEYYDSAALLYTSGTTGPSKGVLVPWAQMYQSPCIMPEGFLQPGRAYYTTYPAFHLSGKLGLYNAAVYQSHMVLRESFSATEFWNDIRKYDVRAAAMLGPVAALIMIQPPAAEDLDNPLDDVMMGPIIPNIDEFKARFGVRRVATGFGMTEIGFPLASGWDPPNPRTCGRRRVGAPGFEIRLGDAHDEPVPVGTTGQMLLRSDDPWVITPGYWGRPEATAEAWRNGWFHTGDVFYEDEDGWFYFVDRSKDALRRRGENVSSFEVEAGILQHPDVAEVAVIGVPSDLNEDEVKAVIVRRPGSELTAEALIEFLIPRMPRFMIPRFVEWTETLPKTDATFRVQKAVLRTDPFNAATWDRDKAGIKLPKD